MKFYQRWVISLFATLALFTLSKMYQFRLLSTYPGVDRYTLYKVERLGLKEMKPVKPLWPEFGPVLNDVTSFHYTLSIPGCKRDSRNQQGKRVFVAVMSDVGNLDQRELVRRSWAQHLKRPSDLMHLAGFGFVVGKTVDEDTTLDVKEEFSDYKDILQVDLIDSEANSTLKMAALLNWLNNECSTVDAVLLVKDNVYVNVRNLANTLVTRSFSNRIGLFGSPLDRLPERRRDKQHYTSYDDWPWSTWPASLDSDAMLMSGQSIRFLLAGFQTIPFIPVLDVYLTGLVAERVGLTLYYNHGMHDPKPKYPLKPCYVRNTISWALNTTSSATMIQSAKQSHAAVREFYDGYRPCVLPINVVVSGIDDDGSGIRKTVSLGKDETVDPDQMVQFPFFPIVTSFNMANIE